MLSNPNADNKPADKMYGIFSILPNFLQIIPEILESNPTPAGIALVAVIGAVIVSGFYFASGSNKPPSFPIEEDSDDATTSMDPIEDVKKDSKKDDGKRQAVFNENTKIKHNVINDGLTMKKNTIKISDSPVGPSETKDASGSSNNAAKQSPNDNQVPSNAAVVNKGCDIGKQYTLSNSEVDENNIEM